MNKKTITASIRTLLEQLPNNWPLYSFVTSNPLAGLEDLRFEEAICKVRKDIGIDGYPSTAVFQQAWENKAIDRIILDKQLQDRAITLSAKESLLQMQKLESQNNHTQLLGEVDRHVIKWLTVFLDEGSAEWGMHERNSGFYKAWLTTARFDQRLPNRKSINALPKEPLEAIQYLTSSYDSEELTSILKHHLFALPGWVGYIKYRIKSPNDWQDAHPITLEDYLAVRLAICSMLDRDFMPTQNPDKYRSKELDKLKLAWLTAMEKTYQNAVFDEVRRQALIKPNGSKTKPDAQLVFCIDTRSERIRRAVEKSGNYETFGYAGFFGVAMDYIHPEEEIHHKSCPPILDAEMKATEKVRRKDVNKSKSFDYYNNLKKALDKLRFSLKNNIPASFGYVESTGFFYAIAMLVRTLAPNLFRRLKTHLSEFIGHPESFSDLILSSAPSAESPVMNELSADKKADIAKAAFSLMGWDNFADLVVFAGHGSQTANNPFGSSLDCGACAGNKGRHNARALANICNDSNVRNILAEQHGIEIPEDTWFLAAEHNTTNNHIHLFDETVPNAFREKVQKLKHNLQTAQNYANIEQFDIAKGDSEELNREAGRRTSDWAETRPEWGLAGNASFIIAPRELTANLDLKARSFLHSYDWQKDPYGKKLEAILQGPMVVTQWINNHYYFATVDNEKFGSGTKVTQNVTGKYGVVQGNGGDLKLGLPLESLHEDDNLIQHLPLRLSVIVYAPVEKVKSILVSNPKTLGKLVENEWVYLTALDPQKNDIHNIVLKNSVTEFTV